MFRIPMFRINQRAIICFYLFVSDPVSLAGKLLARRKSNSLRAHSCWLSVKGSDFVVLCFWPALTRSSITMYSLCVVVCLWIDVVFLRPPSLVNVDCDSLVASWTWIISGHCLESRNDELAHPMIAMRVVTMTDIFVALLINLAWASVLCSYRNYRVSW